MDEPSPTGAAATEKRADLLGLRIFAAIRAMHLIQMVLCLTTGRRGYRKPWLAACAVAAYLAEAVWLTKRWRLTGKMDNVGATVDTALGVAALLAMGAATTDENVTSPLNWSLPTTVGTAACVGNAMGDRDATIAASVLAGTYAVSVRRSLRAGTRPSAIGVSMIGYWGLMWVVRVCTVYIYGYSREIAELNVEAVEKESRLATERERNRQHRVLHDSALQTLEAIGAGWDSGSVHLRADAAREAARLRRWLNGEDSDANTLEVGLAVLASEFVGLHVEVVCDRLDPEPSPDTTTGLCEATREALRNIVKHAESARAVVRCTDKGDMIEVIVRDHGKGFDTGTTAKGFGTTSSIRARLEECGGGAEIKSTPGRGTRVLLWSPR